MDFRIIASFPLKMAKCSESFREVSFRGVLYTKRRFGKQKLPEKVNQPFLENKNDSRHVTCSQAEMKE